MRGGHNKLDAEVKVLRGSFKKSRERAARGPVGKLPRPPAGVLGPVGLKEWRRLAPQVADTLGAGEFGAFIAYCACFERLNRVLQALQREGATEKDQKVAATESRLLKNLSESLGLTPLTRARADKLKAPDGSGNRLALHVAKRGQGGKEGDVWDKL